MIPNVLARLVEVLTELDDTAVVRVNRLEDGDAVPAIVIRAPFTGPATAPAPTWWRGLIDLDVLDVDALTAWNRAVEVQEALVDLIGDVSGHAVIAEVMPAGVVPVSPSGLVPAAGHWIVSVTVTARRPTPQEEPT